MIFTPRYSPEQWAEARRLRAEGLSFAAIAKRVGIATPSCVSCRARKEGWPAGAAGAKHNRRLVRSGRASPATVEARRALALRLYNCIDLELRTLELHMKKKLDAYVQSPAAEPPAITTQERASFAALIDNINKVTEMASEPALAADGRRKSVSLNTELTALSDDIDADALTAASEKDNLRREIADQLEKLVPPA